jgi:hypothetical protein
MKKLLLIALFLPLAQIHAQMLEIQGIGDAKVVDAEGKALPEGEGAKQALRAAAVNAIDKLLELQSASLRQQFNERVKGSVEREEEVKGIINDLKVVVDPIPEQKIVRVRMVGSLDLNTLKDKMNQWSKLIAQVKPSSKQAVVFFTARRTTATEKAGIKVKTNIANDKTSSQLGKEALEENAVETTEKVGTNDTTVVDITDIDKTDKVLWESDTQLKGDFGTALMGQFTDKGFEDVTDGAWFEASEDLDADITEKAAPSVATLKKLLNEVKTAEGNIELIIIGSIDFSAPTEDPVTGMWKVATSVSGKVYKLGTFPPKMLVALGGKTSNGLATSQEEAKKRALEAMAPLAADEIISKLKNKDLLK